MSLSLKAVERVHERLALSYGAQYARMWSGLDNSAVRETWCSELAAFASPSGMQRIAWALENLPDRCPNLIEFKSLCRAARVEQDAPALPQPKADPERVRAELGRVGYKPKDQRLASGAVDQKAWARRLIARHEAGEVLRPYTLQCALEALKRNTGGLA
ncbi:MAG: hypothetical protein Q8M77_05280 [Hydrogenophaga sp.]|nr:hypothetical protein [Hydrogenophaga sp.]